MYNLLFITYYLLFIMCHNVCIILHNIQDAEAVERAIIMRHVYLSQTRRLQKWIDISPYKKRSNKYNRKKNG